MEADWRRPCKTPGHAVVIVALGPDLEGLEGEGVDVQTQES